MLKTLETKDDSFPDHLQGYAEIGELFLNVVWLFAGHKVMPLLTIKGEVNHRQGARERDAFVSTLSDFHGQTWI